jgi:hypothetical protein
MEDESVRQLIAGLPRETARPGFTAAVLRRLAEPERPAARARSWQLAWAGAALTGVVLAAGSWGFSTWRERGEAEEARRMVEQIKAEHAQLAAEVRALREERQPVVYVGGDEDVDLVVDLSRVAPKRGGASRAVAVPVARTTETF